MLNRKEEVMKKKLVYAVLLAGLLAMMTACGKNDKEDNSNSSKKQEEEEEEEKEDEKEDKEDNEDKDLSKNGGTSGDAEDEKKAKGPLLSLNKISLEQQYSEQGADGYSNIQTKRQYFELDEESGKKYLNLANTLHELKEQAEEAEQSSMDYFIQDLKDMLAYGSPSMNLTDESECMILRSDNRVFSFVETNASYYGGAHGSYYIGGQAYDVETGQMILLSDVIKDDVKMKEIVAKRLDEDYGDIFFEDVYTTIDGYTLDNFTWSLDYTGVTLYFNQYELAPYAAGTQSVVLTFAEYPELFDAKYMSAPKQYVMQLEEYAQFIMDVNGDGKEERVELGTNYEYENDYYAPTITVDGNKMDSDSWAFYTDYYLVQSRGKTYLYMFGHHESDYVALTMFDFEKNEFVQGTQDDSPNVYPPEYYKGWNEEDLIYGQTTIPVFNNPDKFLLASRLDVLSTYSGIKTYNVGENGLPVSEDEYYTADVSFLILAKEDVPCKLVKEDGTVIEENSVLPAGTYFKIMYATMDTALVAEAVDYVPDPEADWCFEINEDTTLKTDVLYSIQLDENYGSTINGVDIWDMFDGLVYAG